MALLLGVPDILGSFFCAGNAQLNWRPNGQNVCREVYEDI